MRLLAISILYKPTENVINGIMKYILDVDHLIIWDNTPYNEIELDIQNEIIFNYPNLKNKITFISEGNNKGLSYAYNKAIEFSRENGYTHIMTMDQDSEWECFHKYRMFAEKYFENESSLAILGPIVNEDKQESEMKKVPDVINSGAIIPIAVFDKIGGYCERFLVDAVDIELCYRANRHNIPTIRVKNNGHLKQNFGNMTYFMFNGRPWYATNYNEFRLNGILRNTTLVTRLYPEQKEMRDRLYNVYLKQYTIAILLKEKKKFKKLITIYI